MSNLIPFGKIIKQDGTSAKRDATHMAVVPMYSYSSAKPGDWVKLVSGFSDLVQVVNKGSTLAIGVIDPFLTKPIVIGTRVWVMILPNQVTNVRHSWDHKQLDQAGNKTYLTLIEEKQAQEAERIKKREEAAALKRAEEKRIEDERILQQDKDWDNYNDRDECCPSEENSCC